MQIVINIQEYTYKRIQELARNDYFEHDICGNLMRRIAKGVPLSKGHGNLKDELDLDLFAPSLDIDECIRELMAKHNIDYVNGDDEDKVSAFAIDLVHSCKNVIKTAPTIIEFERSEKNG